MVSTMSADTLSHVAKFLSPSDIEALAVIKDFPLKYVVPFIKDFNTDTMKLSSRYWHLIRSVGGSYCPRSLMNIFQVATHLNDVSLIMDCVDGLALPNTKKLFVACSISLKDSEFKGLNKVEELEIWQLEKITIKCLKHLPKLKKLKVVSCYGIREADLKAYCEKNGISFTRTCGEFEGYEPYDEYGDYGEDGQ